MRKRLILPAIVLVLVAAVIALLAWPREEPQEVLTFIVAPDPDVRAQGWTQLQETGGIDDRLVAVTDALRDADVDALLDGALALDGLGLWSWERQPDLVLREVDARIRSGQGGDALVAAERMMTCPLDMQPEVALPRFEALLTSPSDRARETALEAALGWAGRERVDDRMPVVPPGADRELDRLMWLVDAWKLPFDGFLEVTESTPNHEIAYILHHMEGPAALQALTALAEQGDSTAQAALRHREGWPPPERLYTVAVDPTNPLWQRRLAAWVGAPLSPEAISEILRDDPTEPDGSVYSMVLLAEKRLPPLISSQLARTWITEPDDDRKRAGALLAALIGDHADVLREAYETEDVPEVRTLQRNALMALGEPVGPEDPVEFAYRTLRKPDGDFDPDTVLCLLRAGHDDAIALLVSRPYPSREIYRESVQQRSWLLERFLPSWHEEIGRPLGSDPKSVSLHFDLLRALQLLTQRRMRFDPESGTFAEEADDGQPAADG